MSIDKGVYIIIAGIKSTCAENVCISSTYTIDAQIRYASIGGTYIGNICARNAFIRGVKSI